MTKALTEAEKSDLAAMESKLDHIRSAVRGVVREFHTGLFLHGEGGTSKSYTVTNELRKLKCRHILHNTRLTARGLVEALERAPDEIHLIEDAETLLDDKKSFGVLRSALWSQSTAKPIQRPILWRANRVDINFTFTGGIIVISNVNLADTIPEVRAIKTRINVLGLDFSQDQIKALMKQICLKGYEFGDMFLSPDECLEVRQYVVDAVEVNRRPLDIRVMMNGFRDMLQYKSGESSLHWKDLLAGRLSERVMVVSRAEKNAENAAIARAIKAKGLPLQKQLAMWKEQTGLTQSVYYTSLKRR